MKMLYCERCGGDDLIVERGYRICRYCKSRFQIQPEDVNQRDSHIDLNDDVQRLLRMCTDNPAKATKYASLILDIDPTNLEAVKILRGK